VAPSEDALKDQIAGAKRDVEADLAQLRAQLGDLQRKVALALALLVATVVLFKVGRRIWSRTRD
jgi:hypothetical protein